MGCKGKSVNPKHLESTGSGARDQGEPPDAVPRAGERVSCGMGGLNVDNLLTHPSIRSLPLPPSLSLPLSLTRARAHFNFQWFSPQKIKTWRWSHGASALLSKHLHYESVYWYLCDAKHSALYNCILTARARVPTHVSTQRNQKEKKGWQRIMKS